jgi:hypothetical protein
MIRFTATQDFWSNEFESGYHAGLVYTIRAGNQKLHDIVHNDWLPNGKVVVIPSREAARPMAEAAGRGEIKNGPAPKARKLNFLERIFKWLSRT